MKSKEEVDILREDESEDEMEEKKNDNSDDEMEELEEEEEDIDVEDELDMEEEGEGDGDEMEEKKNKSKINEDEIEVMDDFSENNYDSEENSDIEDDDNILQKFNDNIDTKFLEDIHTETKSVNYDEMIALARVVRDKTGKIIDPLHKTLPFLTKYEKARIIGARAEQLDRGGEAFIPLDETIINGRTIALMEFEAKKIPFIISRPLSNGSVEYWHLRDLEII
jgi:DNA-directed RNA polymerase I, II, and III subunit RPABC2